MNKFLLSIILLTFSVQSNAQIQKGMMLTGGSFSFSGQNSNNEQNLFAGIADNKRRSYNLRINPEIGRFFTESTLVGIGLNLSFYGANTFSNDNNSNPAKWRRNNVAISPYIKKYIELKEKFYFTAFLSFNAGVGEETFSENPENKRNAFILGISARPGLSYFISDRWAIQANLGEIYLNREVWKSESVESISETKSVQFNYLANFRFNSFGVGFNYILGQQDN